MRKRILVIGGGGREHALCWKLKQSPQVAHIYCAPGNGGCREVAECVALAGLEETLAFCKANAVDLVAIGPEQPLVDGWADALRRAGFAVFGPGKAAAQLEGSKGFTKALCGKYGIPTAAYQTFTEPESAKRHARGQRFPLVIKADGLAAGKGVVIAASEEDAVAALDSMFAGAFGAAGQRVVIEEFLEGEEVSFFALSDGETAVEFGHAQDHKRAFDRDQGPNTGGMGAYSPASCMTDGLRAQVMETIILPTVAAMKREGMPFQGVLFAGLMLTREGPKLLEYNARFGDPETQALMVRLESDLYALLSACAEGKLGEMETRFHPGAALCVVMAADGYPGSYRQGTRIYGLEEAAAVPGVMIFHAGTAREGGEVIATGGRVLGVTARGGTIAEAQSRAYQAVDRIVWPEGFCRRDIGWRAIAAA